VLSWEGGLAVHKKEWVPWYRRRDYSGKMSEEEKRILDDVRKDDNHPATSFDELPGEVQTYIASIEQELYDEIKSSIFLKVVSITLFVLFFIVITFLRQDNFSIYSISFWVLGLLVVWGSLWREKRKIEVRFFPEELSQNDSVVFTSDEGIQAAWDVDYLMKSQNTKQTKA
jgi:hypothetical protein